MKQYSRRYRAAHVLETIRDQGRTVAWLARRMGMSRQYTSGLVHGHFDVSEAVASRVATEIGVPLFLLFELSESTDFAPVGVVEEVLA